MAQNTSSQEKEGTGIKDVSPLSHDYHSRAVNIPKEAKTEEASTHMPQILNKYKDATDGTQVIKWDTWLEPFADILRARYSQYQKVKAHIIEQEGSLLQFAQSYKLFGLHRGSQDGWPGVHYWEYAPGASNMKLIGDFNGWNRDSHYLEKKDFGRWHIFIPDYPDGTPRLQHGSRLKVSVEMGFGKWEDRIPPWITRVLQNEKWLFDGVFWEPSHPFQWHYPTPTRDCSQGLRIYEVHSEYFDVGMASIEPKVGTYKEFMRDVLPYVVEVGYNCIQIMAIMEHAYYASFGYQVTNFFASSSRYGTPEDLKELIDQCHKYNIFVLLDVVHSHASKNTLDGLNMFDGTDYLFHAGPKGHHSIWDSRLFNYANWETLRFLLSNLAFYLEEFRFDGFRFDGVTSMLYIHHGIGDNNFDYDHYFKGPVDTDALTYLTLANELIHQIRPNAVSIAEDVSGFACLCRPVNEGGIGFDFRLHMACPDLWVDLLKKVKDEDWKVGSIVWTLKNRRWMEPCISYAESHDQALVGDKTIAFWLMDKEMYTSMSILQPPNPIIARGIALHKLIRLLTMALGGDGYLTFMGNEFGHPEWIDFPRPGNNYSHHYARRRFDLAVDPLLRYQHLKCFEAAINRLEDKYKFLMSPQAYVSFQHEDDKVIVFERAGLLIPAMNPGKYHVILESDRVDYGGPARIDPHGTFFTHPTPYCGLPQSLEVYIPSRSVMVLEKE